MYGMCYWLREPRVGLFISRLIWREMDTFSQRALHGVGFASLW